jgi:hypothetical protein
MSTRLDRLIVVAVVTLILLILAAVVNPLLASPAPQASPVPVQQAPYRLDALPVLVGEAKPALAALGAVQAAQVTVPAPAPVPAATQPPPAAPAPAATTPAPPVSSSTANWAATAFGACVRSRENGGSYAWGTGDGGGAYQFESGTWYAHGAAPGTWGNADAAYQDQIFDNAVAADGDAPWAPYDGCTLGM